MTGDLLVNEVLLSVGVRREYSEYGRRTPDEVEYCLLWLLETRENVKRRRKGDLDSSATKRELFLGLEEAKWSYNMRARSREKWEKGPRRSR